MCWNTSGLIIFVCVWGGIFPIEKTGHGLNLLNHDDILNDLSSVTAIFFLVLMNSRLEVFSVAHRLEGGHQS